MIHAATHLLDDDTLAILDRCTMRTVHSERQHRLVLERSDVNRIPSLLHFIIRVVPLNVLEQRRLVDVLGPYISSETPIAYTENGADGLRAQACTHM